MKGKTLSYFVVLPDEPTKSDQALEFLVNVFIKRHVNEANHIYLAQRNYDCSFELCCSI